MYVDKLNLEELVEDDDNDDGDPSNQYEARSERPNENEDLITWLMLEFSTKLELQV